MNYRKVGQTGVQVTKVSFGSSPLGNMPGTYGYEVGEERARKTIEMIFDGPVNVLDTSRNYGFGRSEARIGEVIKERGGLPKGFVISTKLDRDNESGCFDASQARRSFEESLAALSLDKVQILHLHDPEYARDLSEVTRSGGALDELFKLKEEGLVDAVGLAMGRLDIMVPILRDYPFDALINHNRYTLLNRSANEMYDHAFKRGIAIFNAAPYAGGVLAKGSAVMPRITYQEASQEGLDTVRAVEAVCARHDVPVGAAALHFSTRDPRITSTIVGVSKPERVRETNTWLKSDIPEAFWQEIAALSYSTDDPEANRTNVSPD